MASGPPSPARDSAVAAAPGPDATGVAGGAVAARVRSGSVSSAVTGRPASGTTPLRTRPLTASADSSTARAPEACTMSSVGLSSTPSAGQAMSAGTGVCSSVDRICRPGLSARAAGVGEPAAAEGDEVGVGVGQRDHAPALRHGRELGEPLPGHRGAGARDRRPRPGPTTW